MGLLGATLYFVALFSGFYSGYLVSVLLAGYVLLFEDNKWLKKAAVKAVSVMVLFSFASTTINLIPSAMNLIDSIVSIFGVRFYIAFIANLVNAILTALDILEALLFLRLGVKALNQGTVAVPVVDRLLDKYMG